MTEAREPGTRLAVMVVFGTRPEAIKLCPLVVALQAVSDVEVTLCVTGQHRQMLDQVLSLFKLKPDYDLDIMQPGQDLTDVTTAILSGLRDLFSRFKPDRIFVHGDTNTTLSAALAAFYAGIPVSHVEAGLRTGNILAPWPEEANRKLTSVITDMHYAPTAWARENLLSEGVLPSKIVVTGNTVIDALMMITGRLNSDPEFQTSLPSQFDFLEESRKLILVTGHRRENFGESFDSICEALCQIAQRDDVQIVYPVHLNPNVREPVNRILGDCDNVFLLEPQEYLPFVYLMNKSHLIISDSGGIQEEAPALGKPVLLMRETTERPEAIEAGTVKLVGTQTSSIVDATNTLLDEEKQYLAMSQATNPFGDGHACRVIIQDLLS
ncbi:MAG: UDP-N-acetylglucosamine 2-epimerase (non-hydrolyzing) [Granulosicoccus sp.]|nr:UDP-N-acetylglucosamine 2-epimerase (non-hydrolyzing) [Granulosicoccus sp.]